MKKLFILAFVAFAAQASGPQFLPDMPPGAIGSHAPPQPGVLPNTLGKMGYTSATVPPIILPTMPTIAPMAPMKSFNDGRIEVAPGVYLDRSLQK
jgi:hypothetical protein